MKNHERIQSPLAKARGLGAAKEGVHHWWIQRVTAIALIPLSLYFLYILPVLVMADYDSFILWIGQPLPAIAALLFIVIGFYHAVLGLQVVIEDYVSHELTRMLTIIATKIFFFFLGLASVYAVIALNFR